MIEAYAAVGFVLAVAGGAVGVLVRMAREDRALRDQVEQHARDALLPSGSTAFDDGALAALSGAELWANPHCSPTGRPDRATAWMAGWCHGRQLLRDAWRVAA